MHRQTEQSVIHESYVIIAYIHSFQNHSKPFVWLLTESADIGSCFKIILTSEVFPNEQPVTCLETERGL